MITIKPNTKIQVKNNLRQINEVIEAAGYPTLGIGSSASWIFLHENYRTSWSSHDCFPDFQEIFIDLPNPSEKPNSSGYPLAKDLNGLQSGYYQVDNNTMNMPQLQDGWCGDICNSNYDHEQYVTFLDDTGNEIHKLVRHIDEHGNTGDWRPLPVEKPDSSEFIEANQAYKELFGEIADLIERYSNISAGTATDKIMAFLLSDAGYHFVKSMHEDDADDGVDGSEWIDNLPCLCWVGWSEYEEYNEIPEVVVKDLSTRYAKMYQTTFATTYNKAKPLSKEEVARFMFDKHKKLDWVDGLPPVGAECEVWVDNARYWAKVKVLAVDGDVVVWRNGPNKKSYIGTHKDDIRPIETPEQSAKRKRDEWVKEAVEADIFVNGFSFAEPQYLLLRVYDWLLKTGQLKESENES